MIRIKPTVALFLMTRVRLVFCGIIIALIFGFFYPSLGWIIVIPAAFSLLIFRKHANLYGLIAGNEWPNGDLISSAPSVGDALRMARHVMNRTKPFYDGPLYIYDMQQKMMIWRRVQPLTQWVINYDAPLPEGYSWEYRPSKRGDIEGRPFKIELPRTEVSFSSDQEND